MVSVRWRQFGLRGRLFAVALMAVGAPALASATTSLSYHWSDIQCGVSSPGGPVYSTCSQPSFSARVQPGESVFVTATLNYTYSDDGAALASLGAFQLDSMGLRMLFVDHEAGGLYLSSNQCRDARGRCPPFRTEFIDAFNGPDYLIFGNNDAPDSFSGRATYSASTSVIPNWPFSAQASAFMGVYHTVTYSGSSVPAIPEPSTPVLFAAGLLALGALMRCRLAPTPG
jgi:hypothetical protein